MEVSFEEFEELLFTVTRDVGDELFEVDLCLDAKQKGNWLIPILENWKEKALTMSAEEHNQVLWRIKGYPLFVGFLLRESSKLNIDEKCELLRAAEQVTLSIPDLFKPEAPIENGYFMLWHSLIKSVADAETACVALKILSDLSLHNDERVQASALHGLGHLNHPGREAAVDLFIQFHPDAKENEWIQQCRAGTVM